MPATCSWIKRLRHVFTRLRDTCPQALLGWSRTPGASKMRVGYCKNVLLYASRNCNHAKQPGLDEKTNNFVHFLKSGSPWDEWERQSDQSAQKGIAGRAKGIHCSHEAHCLVGQLTKVRRCHHSVVTWVSGELQTTVPKVHERKINVKANYLLYSDNEEQEKQSEFPFWNQLFPGRRLPSIRWSAKIGRLVSGRISSQSQISEKIMTKYY